MRCLLSQNVFLLSIGFAWAAQIGPGEFAKPGLAQVMQLVGARIQQRAAKAQPHSPLNHALESTAVELCYRM
jgi:hypothetical protein